MKKTLAFVFDFVCISFLCVIIVTLFVKRKPLRSRSVRPQVEREIAPSYSKAELDAAVCKALDQAYVEAEKYADSQLDMWVEKTMKNADSFLDDYYRYSHVKIREVSDVYHTLGNKFLGDVVTSAEDALLEELNSEISSKVIQPSTAKLTFKRIMRETGEVYSETLTSRINDIKVRYNVPDPDWDSYIIGLCNTITDSGTSLVPTYEKGIAAGGAVTMIVVGDLGSRCFKKIGSDLGKVFGKTTDRILAKNGSKVLAKESVKIGSKSVSHSVVHNAGYFVTAAVLVWDILDYGSTVKNDKPVLRANIESYMYEVKDDLMHDNEYGIMEEIKRSQNKIVHQLKSTSI